MKPVNAEPKNGEVFAIFRKTPNGTTCLLKFTDQFGIERALIITEQNLGNVWRTVEPVLNGRGIIMAPDEGVKNVYEQEQKIT